MLRVCGGVLWLFALPLVSSGDSHRDDTTTQSYIALSALPPASIRVEVTHAHTTGNKGKI